MSSTFFTTEDGDVILRAGQDPSSKHDFRVHKFILSLASSVFKDMFTFPQPPGQNQIGQCDIPIIDIPDSPQTLDTILRFIYPGVELPKFTDLSTLSDLLAVTDKYNIVSMRPVLRDGLSSFIETQPSSVYIIACRLGLLKEAKAAARITTPDSIIVPEDHEEGIKYISGVDLYRLLWFCQTRETMMETEIRKFVPTPPGNNPCLGDHWLQYEDFYGELEQKLLVELRINPRIACGDLTAVLTSLPDPPPSCFDQEVDAHGTICPFLLSFIRARLELLARRLEEVSEELLKRAFEKEF